MLNIVDNFEILNTITDQIILYDTDFLVQWANSSAKQYFSLKDEELNVKKYADLLKRQNRSFQSSPMLRSFNSKSLTVETIQTTDGRTWEVRVFPVRDEQGDLIGLIEVRKEIDELDKQKGELKEKLNEQRFFTSVLIDSVTNDIIMLVTLEGDIRFINRTGAEWFGKEPREMIGKNIVKLYSSYIKKRLQGVINKKKRQFFINQINGTIFENTYYPVIDESGELEYVAIFSRDVTEIHELENKLIQITEDERYNIGQTLHDGLGQLLTGTSYMLNVLHKKLVKKNIDEQEIINKLLKNNNSAIDIVRKVTKDLLPVSLEADSLVSAVENMLNEINMVFRVKCSIIHRGIIFLNTYIATHIYYIIREAVNNALKHGNPAYINVYLIFEHNEYHVKIVNDINNPEITRGKNNISSLFKGVGRDIMQYRARLIGAELSMGLFEKEYRVELQF